MLTSASFGQVRDYDLSTGDQWELGSKFDFLDGRGSATLAAYRIVRRDFSVADPNNPNLSVPVGQQTSRGIEAAASLRITPKLLAEGNFAWVDAQYDEFTENVGGVAVSRKGKTPPNVPERVGNLWLTYDFDPAWQGGVDARYVSSVYANNANTWHAPSYTVYGLSSATGWTSARGSPGACATSPTRSTRASCRARRCTTSATRAPSS